MSITTRTRSEVYWAALALLRRSSLMVTRLLEAFPHPAVVEIHIQAGRLSQGRVLLQELVGEGGVLIRIDDHPGVVGVRPVPEPRDRNGSPVALRVAASWEEEALVSS